MGSIANLRAPNYSNFLRYQRQVSPKLMVVTTKDTKKTNDQ